jgi:hypothetical protein
VAALCYNIPIVSVTIANDTPHLLRAGYRAPADIALEALGTMCLSGPEAETLFCGAINDGSDQIDHDMARRYLSQQFNALQIGAEFTRLRDAAQRLVRTPWAEQRIRLLAAALLRCETLSAEEVFEVALSSLPSA